ncbi:MAG: hypothetical protein KAT79_05205, partial [candidate division Zixibacteria bacterium]|nr:hypothetical protein [candidate division Zixibacteria bacterium]
ESGHIHVAYTETSTNYLVTRKLTFSGGDWSVGSKVTIYNGAQSENPSLAIEPGGKLWIAWTRISGGDSFVNVKASTDSGATWGSGAADAGEALTSAVASAFAKVVVRPGDIDVVYTSAGTAISHRTIPIDGGSWATAFDVATGTGFDDHFDAVVADDGMLAIAFDDGQLKFREHDGNNWGAVVTLDSDGGQSPQVAFKGGVPVVFYLSETDSLDKLFMYTSRQSGSFSTPVALDGRAKPFDTVALYSTGYSSFADLTDKSAGSTAAEVYHPSSNVFVKDQGDQVYFGMDESFRFIRFDLSTAGVGGSVTYSYWNGSTWIAFTPADGTFALDQTDKELRLWGDYKSIPSDWQKKIIEGDLRFWIKVEVTGTFSTGAVGSQITAVSSLTAVSVRR